MILFLISLFACWVTHTCHDDHTTATISIYAPSHAEEPHSAAYAGWPNHWSIDLQFGDTENPNGSSSPCFLQSNPAAVTERPWRNASADARVCFGKPGDNAFADVRPRVGFEEAEEPSKGGIGTGTLYITIFVLSVTAVCHAFARMVPEGDRDVKQVEVQKKSTKPYCQETMTTEKRSLIGRPEAITQATASGSCEAFAWHQVMQAALAVADSDYDNESTVCTEWRRLVEVTMQYQELCVLMPSSNHGNEPAQTK